MEFVLKPEGPTLAVGKVRGLNIGTEGGQLQVQGDLRSRVMRRDDVPAEVVGSTQKQLEEGVTAAVVAIVQTINAVALDPVALAGVTEEALQSALNSIRPINSSNAKKMANDISEQLRFVNVQIVAGMLGPVNEAFNQLRDTDDLEKQLTRLPGTTQGLVDLFKKMNEQIEEIAKGENTDVLRQLSAVRNQVEHFGLRIAQTAANVAGSIVEAMTTRLGQAARNIDATLADQAKEFNAVMTESFRAMGVLRATKDVLQGAGLGAGGIQGELDRLTAAMGETAGRFAEIIVTRVTMNLEQAATTLDASLARQITDFNAAMTESFEALGFLRSAKGALDQGGIGSGGIVAQIERLMRAMGDTAATIATQIVSTALRDLEVRGAVVQQQPLTVQATTVQSLLNDSLAALMSLQLEWQRLNAVGIDSSGIARQFERLLGGMLSTTTALLTQAFAQGDFPAFLNVLAAVPPALAAMNPELQRLQQMGTIFAQVVGPITHTIEELADGFRTVGERVLFSGQRHH